MKKTNSKGDLAAKLIKDEPFLKAFEFNTLNDGDKQMLVAPASLTNMMQHLVKNIASAIPCEHFCRIFSDIVLLFPNSVEHLGIAVPALAQAMEVHAENDGAATQACRFGTALCSSVELRNQLAGEMIPSLLKLMDTNKTPTVAIAAADFLNVLATSGAAAMETVRTCGGLVTVLDVMETNIGSPDVVEVGSELLATLCSDPANTALIGNEGGMDIIMNSLKQFPTVTNIVLQSFSCLAHLSQSEEIRQILVEDGGMDTILEATMAHATSDAEIATRALATVNHLLMDDQLKLHACRAGGAVALASILTVSTASEIRTLAARALMALAAGIPQSAEIQTAFADNRVGVGLLAMLNNADASVAEIASSSALLLQTMSLNESQTISDVAAASPSIVSVIKKHVKDEALMAPVLDLVSALSMREEAHSLMINAGMLDALMLAMATHARSVEVLQRCLIAVGCLTIQVAAQKKLVAVNLIAMLINCFAAHPTDGTTMMLTCKVVDNLATLAAREEMTNAFLQQRGGQALATTLEKSCTADPPVPVEVVEAMIKTLANLADAHPGLVAAQRGGVAMQSVLAHHAKDPRLALKAVEMLGRICGEEDVRKQASSLIGMFAQLLAASPTPSNELQTTIAYALSALIVHAGKDEGDVLSQIRAAPHAVSDVIVATASQSESAAVKQVLRSDAQRRTCVDAAAKLTAAAAAAPSASPPTESNKDSKATNGADAPPPAAPKETAATSAADQPQNPQDSKTVSEEAASKKKKKKDSLPGDNGTEHTTNSARKQSSASSAGSATKSTASTSARGQKSSKPNGNGNEASSEDLNETKRLLQEAREKIAELETTKRTLEKQIAEFQSTKTAQDAQLKGFQEQLSSKDAEIVTAREQLSVLTNERDDLKRKNEETNQQIEEIGRSVSDREARIKKLEEELLNRDQTQQPKAADAISGSTAELEQATQRIQELERSIGERDTKIAKLEEDLRSRETQQVQVGSLDDRERILNEMERGQSEKAAELKQLADQLAEREKQIAEKEAAEGPLEDRQNKMAHREEELLTRETKAAEREAAVAERESAVDSKEKEYIDKLAARETALKEKEAKEGSLEERKSQLDAREAVLNDRDQALVAREKDLADRARMLEEKEAAEGTLSARKHGLDDREASLKEKEEDLEYRQSTFAERESSIAPREAEAISKEENAKAMLEEAKLKEKESLDRLDDVVRRENELETKRKEMEEKASALESKAEDLQVREDEIQMLESDYKDREAELTKKEALVAELESKWGSKEAELTTLDAQIKKREEELDRKLKGMGDKEALLSKREGEVGSVNASIDQRLASVSALEKKVKEREDLIANQDTVFERKNKEIAARMKAVEEKEESLDWREKALNRREKESEVTLQNVEKRTSDLKKKEETTKARDKELDAKQKALAAREKDVLVKEKDIERRETAIRERSRKCDEREQEMAKRASEVGQREADIFIREGKVESKEEEITHRDKDLERREKDLQAIAEKVDTKMRDIERRETEANGSLKQSRKLEQQLVEWKTELTKREKELLEWMKELEWRQVDFQEREDARNAPLALVKDRLKRTAFNEALLAVQLSRIKESYISGKDKLLRERLKCLPEVKRKKDFLGQVKDLAMLKAMTMEVREKAHRFRALMAKLRDTSTEGPPVAADEEELAQQLLQRQQQQQQQSQPVSPSSGTTAPQPTSTASQRPAFSSSIFAGPPSQQQQPQSAPAPGATPPPPAPGQPNTDQPAEPFSKEEKQKLQTIAQRERQLSDEASFMGQMVACPLGHRQKFLSDAELIVALEQWWLDARDCVNDRNMDILKERLQLLKSGLDLFAQTNEQQQQQQQQQPKKPTVDQPNTIASGDRGTTPASVQETTGGMSGSAPTTTTPLASRSFKVSKATRKRGGNLFPATFPVSENLISPPPDPWKRAFHGVLEIREKFSPYQSLPFRMQRELRDLSPTIRRPLRKRRGENQAKELLEGETDEETEGEEEKAAETGDEDTGATTDEDKEKSKSKKAPVAAGKSSRPVGKKPAGKVAMMKSKKKSSGGGGPVDDDGTVVLDISTTSNAAAASPPSSKPKPKAKGKATGVTAKKGAAKPTAASSGEAGKGGAELSAKGDPRKQTKKDELDGETAKKKVDETAKASDEKDQKKKASRSSGSAHRSKTSSSHHSEDDEDDDGDQKTRSPTTTSSSTHSGSSRGSSASSSKNSDDEYSEDSDQASSASSASASESESDSPSDSEDD